MFLRILKVVFILVGFALIKTASPQYGNYIIAGIVILAVLLTLSFFFAAIYGILKPEVDFLIRFFS